MVLFNYRSIDDRYLDSSYLFTTYCYYSLHTDYYLLGYASPYCIQMLTKFQNA